MFWLGSIITVFAIMMMSLCKEYYQFILAQGILLGIGNTLLLCPAVALVGKYFRRKMALAVGVTIAGSSLGGVIWPVVVHALLQKPSIGFGWTMRIAGFIMLPILVVSSIIARPPLTPKAPQVQGSGNDGEHKAAKPARPAWDWSLVTKPEMVFTALGFFFVYFGMFMPFFYTTSYSLAYGFSSNLSFYTVSIINGASLFGRVLPGIVADRYGRFNLCFAMTMLSGIIALCWTKATSVAGIVLFSIAYGFTSGVSLASSVIVPKTFFDHPYRESCLFNRHVPHRSQHRRQSALQSASCWVYRLSRECIAEINDTYDLSTDNSDRALASTPIGGALIEKYGYLSLSIYTGVSLLLGSAVLLVAKLSQNRKLFAVV